MQAPGEGSAWLCWLAEQLQRAAMQATRAGTSCTGRSGQSLCTLLESRSGLGVVDLHCLAGCTVLSDILYSTNVHHWSTCVPQQPSSMSACVDHDGCLCLIMSMPGSLPVSSEQERCCLAGLMQAAGCHEAPGSWWPAGSGL